MSGRGRWVDPFAGMPGRRLFVAVPLPEDAAAAVSTIVDDVRGQALPDGMHDVRWVRLDGLHLTLRFLGPTAPERIEPTALAVRSAAAESAPLRLTIAGAGTFPPGPRPRTLWLGLGEGLESLVMLAAATDRALRAAGWSFDDRPLRPHLTLARADGLPAGPLVAARLASAIADRTIVADIDRVGLFESVTGGGPARYVPVDEAPLGAAPSDAPPVYHRS
jgi:2'-5' RNA ligase